MLALLLLQSRLHHGCLYLVFHAGLRGDNSTAGLWNRHCEAISFLTSVQENPVPDHGLLVRNKKV